MKVLHIIIGKHQLSHQQAFKAIASEYRMIDWTENPSSLDTAIRATLLTFKPDLTFMQLQREGLVRPDTLDVIPGFKVNWTGDVRFPTPQWYIDLAPHFSVTLFSNEYDVSVLKAKGLRSEYLNIGFDEGIYNRYGDAIETDVVFMGNNYGNTFPLSSYRMEVVQALRKQRDFNFTVCGSGWPFPTENLNNDPQREAAYYRGAKMAINISHFDYPGYSSDRMLRIMGCGTLCLSHHYQGIEHQFSIGQQLDTFRSIPELVEMIRYYLRNKEAGARIAHNGNEHAWNHHRWENRVTDLLTYKTQYENAGIQSGHTFA